MISDEVRSHAGGCLTELVVDARAIKLIRDRAAAGIEITNHIRAVVDELMVVPELLLA
jgi:hypothetical protein